MSKSTKDVVKEALQEISEETFEKDEEFSPEEEKHRFGLTPERMDMEGRLIDELLASVPRSEGYYLKLFKEIGPHDFQFKLRVDNWEAWSDVEWEVANIVQAYTKKNPQKWGSGVYKLTVWREGGQRGDARKPMFFNIDAGEFENSLNGNGNGNTPYYPEPESIEKQIGALGTLLNAFKQVTPQTSPEQMQTLISDAFKQGLAIKANQERTDAENQQSTMGMVTSLLNKMLDDKNQMVLHNMNNANKQPVSDPMALVTQTMVTMMQMFKSAGVFDKTPIPVTPQRSLKDEILELRELGLLAKPENPIDQLTKLQPIISMFSNLSGGGSHAPSIGEKALEVLGPHIPKMVGDITGAVTTVANLKSMKNRPIPDMSKKKSLDRKVPTKQFDIPFDPFTSEGLPNDPDIDSAKNIMDIYKNPYENMDLYANDEGWKSDDFPSTLNNNPVNVPKPVSTPNVENVKSKEDTNMPLPILKPLLNAIKTNDTSYFPELKDMLIELTSWEVYNKIAKKEISIQTIIDETRPWVGNALDTPQAKNYFNKFVDWASVLAQNEFMAICSNPECKSEYAFDSKEDFLENSSCPECGEEMKEDFITN